MRIKASCSLSARSADGHGCSSQADLQVQPSLGHGHGKACLAAGIGPGFDITLKLPLGTDLTAGFYTGSNLDLLRVQTCGKTIDGQSQIPLDASHTEREPD